jgi:hypothetical protein
MAMEALAMFTISRPENFAAAQALAQLEHRYSTAEQTLAYETAIEHLVSVGFLRGTAIECLNHLRQQGYLYESANGLRLTDGV